jgi:hypothetical protein
MLTNRSWGDNGAHLGQSSTRHLAAVGTQGIRKGTLVVLVVVLVVVLLLMVVAAPTPLLLLLPQTSNVLRSTPAFPSTAAASISHRRPRHRHWQC